MCLSKLFLRLSSCVCFFFFFFSFLLVGPDSSFSVWHLVFFFYTASSPLTWFPAPFSVLFSFPPDLSLVFRDMEKKKVRALCRLWCSVHPNMFCLASVKFLQTVVVVKVPGVAESWAICQRCCEMLLCHQSSSIGALIWLIYWSQAISLWMPDVFAMGVVNPVGLGLGRVYVHQMLQGGVEHLYQMLQGGVEHLYQMLQGGVDRAPVPDATRWGRVPIPDVTRWGRVPIPDATRLR